MTGKKLPHATLLGQGLMELVENHLSDLPSVNGSPFTLVVTLGYDALLSGLGVAVTDTGHRISAAEARRLACKAGIIPLVLGGDSMPLDVGREKRLFDRYQKIAINHRYHGCAAHNCDRPPGLDGVPPRRTPGTRAGPPMRRTGSRCARRTTTWPTTPRPTTRPGSPTARSASPDANRQ